MGDLIIKPEAGGSIKLQNNAGTNALVSDNSGNVTLAGSTTISGGTISSAVTFPAGHVLQMKVVHLPCSGGSISSGASGFTGVSQTDITVNRTSGTKLLYTLSGGGGYTNASGNTLRTLAKRTSGASFTGTEVALGDTSQGNSRTYGAGAGVLIPYSSVAIDSDATLSGNYTYRWFYTGHGNTVDFTTTDRGDITVTIMEFKHS